MLLLTSPSSSYRPPPTCPLNVEAQTLGQLAETDLLHEIVPRVRGLHHLLQGDAVSGEDGDSDDGGHLGHEDAEQGGEADGLAGAVLGQRQSDVVEPGVGDGALLAAAVAQLAGQQPSERGLGEHSLTIQLSAGLGRYFRVSRPQSDLKLFSVCTRSAYGARVCSRGI